MRKDIPHKTKLGLVFDIALNKKQLTAAHNYWLYFIVARHAELGHQAFTLMVTKQAFPDEKQADHLASTLAIDEAKRRLEEVEERGRPIRVPFFMEGWALL